MPLITEETKDKLRDQLTNQQGSTEEETENYISQWEEKITSTTRIYRTICIFNLSRYFANDATVSVQLLRINWKTVDENSCQVNWGIN